MQLFFFAIGSLALLCEIFGIFQYIRRQEEKETESVHIIAIADTEVTTSTVSGPSEPMIIYDTPHYRSSCGTSLGVDEVEWIGPMKSKCPECGSVLKAKRRFT